MASFNGRPTSTSRPDPRFQVCIIGNSLKENKQLLQAIEKFNLKFVFSESGTEFLNSGAEFTTIFLLEEFEGNIYTTLHKAGQRILGPTTVMQYAERKVGLPNNIRPLYTLSMTNLVISFTGFRTKEDLSSMVSLIHHMGGSVRKDFNVSKTTHLIASPSATFGEKYKYAASLGIPIMSSEWVYKAWERRHDLNANVTSEEFMQYKLKPFEGCKMAFIGYQNEEEQHMVEVSLKNGGEIVKAADPACSHIVVEDGCLVDSADYARKVKIVKNEWFWACIQMEAKAEEILYAFENQPTAVTSSSVIVPTRGNKRKRFESAAHQLHMESLNDSNCFSMNPDYRKRSDINKLSISGSFLDSTLSPDKSLDMSCDAKDNDITFIRSPLPDLRALSPRQLVCLELFQTESNYVGILNTIITVFKEPLEHPEQRGGPLLAPAEIKIIFGNLPPIFEIHQKIRNELANIVHSWSDDHSIGNLILNHADDLVKAYPPFVNFFEKTKEVLNNCDASKPRFHAFLKRCQSKPECGRQTLQELLIRPVQRLPSIILLLGDILKHTPKSCSDHTALENAIQALKNVMLHINEDKRKTEGQVALFDILNDIENCPVYLLNAKRVFISKTDMVEATDLLMKKQGPITMFLFNDIVEICKKRSKATNSMRSPSVISMHGGPAKSLYKSYKHLELIELKHIKRVVDITETEEIRNYFAIVVAIPIGDSKTDFKEYFYAFVLLEETDKMAFLKVLCRTIANINFQATFENLLTSVKAEDLPLHSNDSSGNALSKAMFKARDKLGRALSMRRTPTKRGLSRAVSTIMTPLRNFGTPSNNISTLRLSSVTNLSEFESNPNSLSCSPVGFKKMKANSLGVHAAKEL